MTRYGVDLITFYDPGFWGVDSYDDIVSLRHRDPKRIWGEIFDALNEAGIELIETTFPPGDRQSALDAFGSAEGFRDAAAAQGIALKSVFHLGLDWLDDTRSIERIVADAVADAEFARAAGGDTLVVGPPMRRTWNDAEPRFVGIELAHRFAEVAHRVGAATLELGVRTAIHTEAHSIFCAPSDIDLLLGATDPNYVFFCPDTAHITLAGGDPVQVVGRHLERAVIAHWKDATGPQSPYLPIDESVHLAHREHMTALGTGIVDWDAWIELWSRSSAADVRLLELDATPNPVAEMIAGREYLEARTPATTPTAAQ